MSDKINYAQIDDCDWEHDQTAGRKNARLHERCTTMLISFLLGLATMGAISLLVSFSRTSARIMPPTRNGTDSTTGLPLSWYNGDCGNSPQDAKSRGCRYSIALHAWLPESCLTDADAEDAKEMYDNRDDWYYQAAANQNMTLEELSQGDYEWFTTTLDWHVAHCMYVWKRLHRVVLDPSQELDSYTASEHHTNHCVKMVAGGYDMDDVTSTKVFVKYPRCAK